MCKKEKNSVKDFIQGGQRSGGGLNQATQKTCHVQFLLLIFFKIF